MCPLLSGRSLSCDSAIFLCQSGGLAYQGHQVGRTLWPFQLSGKMPPPKKRLGGGRCGCFNFLARGPASILARLPENWVCTDFALCFPGMKGEILKVVSHDAKPHPRRMENPEFSEQLHLCALLSPVLNSPETMQQAPQSGNSGSILWLKLPHPERRLACIS